LLFANIKTIAQRSSVLQSLEKLQKATKSDNKQAIQLETSAAYLLVNTDSALYYANQVLQSKEVENNKILKADAYLALGECYNYMNQHIQAIEYLLDARDIYEQENNQQGLGDSYYALGELYGVLKRYAISRNYFFRASNQFLQLNDLEYLANSYVSLGDNYCSEKMLDSAMHFTQLALKIGVKNNFAAIQEYSHGNLAAIFIEEKKFSEAIQHLNTSVQLSKELGNDYGIAYSQLLAAKIYSGLNNYSKAITLIDSCIKAAQTMKMDDLIMDAEQVKYAIGKKFGNTAQALASLENYTTIYDTLLSSKKFTIINSLLEKYRSAKKQSELDVLHEVNHKNRIVVIGLILAFLLLLLLSFSIYKRFNERKLMLNKLYVQHNSIQDQASTLKQINHVKDRMFSIISHDLRGPVASLKGLIEFMKSESLTAQESEMVVKELKQSVGGIDMLLENLLVWAQIQIRGDVSSKSESIHVQTIANEIIFIATNAAQQKNIELTTLIEDDLIILADRNHISLIIRNLVNNAIKFTPQNGKVVIEASKQPNGKVKLCVEDNGVGMTQDEIAKLFNVEKTYSQLGTENEKGSGLGLMFVKEYIQNLGGNFTITSTKGKGSRFCVTV
jgi:signal transduction histidine kinase